MAKSTRKEFTVEGSGSFPIDMLRHDACWPATSKDAFCLEDGSSRRIVLRTDWAHAPTIGRWNSFGWRVFS